MATTTNYGWATPDNTDLVKNGALAIRTLGSSVDTTTKALNPSTTLGDIEYRSATANTNTRLGIGSNGQVLTVAAGVPSWAAAASGSGLTLLSTTTFSGTSTTISSISQSYKTLYGVMFGLTGSGAQIEANIKLNGDASNHLTSRVLSGGTGQSSSWTINQGQGIAPTGGNNVYSFEIDNYTSTTNYKSYSGAGGFIDPGGGSPFAISVTQGGFYQSNTAITSITIAHVNSATGGTILLYGAN
jgi:hypothetical protein